MAGWLASKSSLKTKFSVGSGVFAFIFSLAFTIWTLKEVESDMRSGVIAEQRALVHAMASEIEQKVELRHDALTTIAAIFSTAAPSTPAEMEAFFQSRPVLRKMFDGVTVVDLAGHVQFEANPEFAMADHDIISRRYFQAISSGSSFEISEPQRLSPSGEPFEVFAVPLRSPSGQRNGALLCTLFLHHPNFLGDLGQVKIGRQGYFAVIQTGAVPHFVMHGHREEIMAPLPPGSDDAALVQSATGAEGTIEGPDVLGVKTLRSFTPIRSMPWVLVAVHPTEEAFASLHDRRRHVIGMGALFFALAFGTAWLMASELLRPLARLQREVERAGARSEPIEDAESYGSTELITLVNAYNAQALRRKDFENRLLATRERLRGATDSIPASIAHLDTQQRYTFANTEISRVLGANQVEMLGHTVREMRGEVQYAEIRPYLERALQGERVSFENTRMIDGERHYYQSDYVPELSSEGLVLGFYAMTFDITALKLAQQRQAKVEARLRAITDSLPVLICYIDRDERVGFLNETFRTWYGIDPITSVGRDYIDLIGHERNGSHHQKLQEGLSGRRIAFELESATLSGMRNLHITYIPDINADGRVDGLYSITHDVTEVKDAQLQLAKLVRSDVVTGLPNRFHFNEVLPEAIARAKLSATHLALMFLDIDHFKEINDRWGHAAGDAVLIKFARRLEGSLRVTDLVARLAGDEFVVILEGVRSKTEVERIASKILERVERPFDISTGKSTSTMQISTSIGICIHGSGLISPSQLLERADAALYQAKSSGRNTYRIFDAADLEVPASAA